MLVTDLDVQEACDSAVASAYESADGRSLAIDRNRLRVLDAALWSFPIRAR